MNKQEQINESRAFLEKNGVETDAVGIILGTGLGDFIDHVQIERDIPYSAIPHFPKPTHAYEGLSYFEITYPVRLMHALGVQQLIISNAAGAINLAYKKGEVMLIEDHINLQAGSPLAEKGIEELGERFVDMNAPYSPKLIREAKRIAQRNNFALHAGVYAAVTGPQLETKAEYRYLKIIGADAVGMSTVPEVIVANQLQIECIAFSVLTDLCDPQNLAPINIEDIMASAKKAEQSLIIIVKELLSTQKK
jgi:purine-nucleoside phosphorylase